jgi:SAM-dependent methyltransferase
VTDRATLDSLAAWQTVAGGWERRRSFVWGESHAVGEMLVDALDPQPGETILELAAGPGDTGFTAARRLGSAGRLVSTDFAPEMVAVAERRSSELGLDNVEHRVVDAQAIDLPDASIDGVLCRWGYMLMPSPLRALAETRRVLRPGGRVAFSVWAEAEANPWASTVGRIFVELGLAERPDPDAPGPFRLGDGDRVRLLVDEAGFEQIVIEDVALTWRYDGFETFWEIARDLSFMLTTTLATLGDAAATEARERARAALAVYENEDGSLAIPGLTRNVTARPVASG